MAAKGSLPALALWVDHIDTQASMWADVMGGGPYYHGAEFRLGFHHTHNARQLMNADGAKRWVALMVQALDASEVHTFGETNPSIVLPRV